MVLCDQAAKYILPTGRPGMARPAIILDKLFVAIPLPKRAYKTVLKGAIKEPKSKAITKAQTGLLEIVSKRKGMVFYYSQSNVLRGYDY